MTKKGKVYFKDHSVGTIEQRPDASYEFRYPVGAHAVSWTLPKTSDIYTSEDLFPFFDGLIPEGWLLNLIRKNWKIAVNDRMALLLTTCRDCIGAAHVIGEEVEAAPAKVADPKLKSSHSYKSNRCLVCLEDLKASENLYHKKCAMDLFGTASAPQVDVGLEDFERMALHQVNQRLTLTGVQKKLSLSALLDDDKRQRLTAMGFDGNYILKPPSPDYPEMPEIEHVCMKLAELHSLRMAKCGLVYLASGELAYITRRFDRVGSEKIQVEDFCQLCEKATNKKYTGSTESMGNVIDRYSDQAADDRVTLFQMVVFSFWIGNTDMHLKNFSLWRDPESGSVRMSPGYDFLSTRLLISKKDDLEELALTVNGRKNKLGWKDFVKFGDTLKIPAKVQSNIRDQIFDLEKDSIALIERSFLSPKMREGFVTLLKQHKQRLK